MESESEGGKDYSFVAPLAILPEHQGKGLGSSLLRAGIQIGYDNGYKDCMLTVNGENENALKLYYKDIRRKVDNYVSGDRDFLDSTASPQKGAAAPSGSGTSKAKITPAIIV